MNYQIYRMNTNELLFSALSFILIDAIVSYLFYDSVFSFLVGLPIYVIYYKRMKNRLINKRLYIVRQQFCEMIEALSSGLSAGLSVDHAIIESRKDMVKNYGENSYIASELQDIIAKLKTNQPIENGLVDFANRTGIPEIKDFTDIFTYAKRSGGSFREIISRTARMMREKTETEKEIEVLLNGKKLEQRIMSIIPFFIICYLRVSSPEFMDVLYHNLGGYIVMTICLIVYVFSLIMSEKIASIKV